MAEALREAVAMILIVTDLVSEEAPVRDRDCDWVSVMVVDVAIVVDKEADAVDVIEAVRDLGLLTEREGVRVLDVDGI